MQWSVERFIEHLFVFLAIFGAAVLQRVFSCILFLSIIFQGVRAVTKPPGYAPITYKLLTKITAGLFLDLAGLLPDNIRTQEIEPQAFLEGKLVVSGSKKRVIEIADIITWIEAFTIFSMILCHTFSLAGKI